MVCLSKHLPEYFDGFSFSRGDWHRALFYQDHVGLERCVESSDSAVELKVTDFNTSLNDDFKFQYFFMDRGMAVSIFYTLAGFVSGAVKLLQYYNILEKYVPK